MASFRALYLGQPRLYEGSMTAAIHSPGLSAEIWGLLVESLIMEWRALLMLCGLMLTAMSGAFTQYVQTSGSPLLNTFWLLAILFMILSVVVTHIFSVHIARYSNENRGRAWRANFGGLPRWADIYMLLALPRVLLLWGVIMLITGIYIYIFDKVLSFSEKHGDTLLRVLTPVVSGISITFIGLIVCLMGMFLRLG